MAWPSQIWYGFDKSTVNGRAPNVSGVYVVKGSDGKWLHVGESARIASGLLRHLTGKNARLIEGDPAMFSYELCGAEKRTLRRDALIAEFLPGTRAPETP